MIAETADLLIDDDLGCDSWTAGRRRGWPKGRPREPASSVWRRHFKEMRQRYYARQQRKRPKR